ncbi:hypothetical protein C4D60_Mb07t04280 [Musa balbisiana]|uniref:Uncharacterized protein n=1 Tax=Musa balbisiana TaxID=52838 RepID=A0A4S8JCX3_MUSBA|nr:hypothetical protein C4D60_Mb07t04280 [Musa balbisiana]
MTGTADSSWPRGSGSPPFVDKEIFVSSGTMPRPKQILKSANFSQWSMAHRRLWTIEGNGCVLVSVAEVALRYI